MGPVSVFIVFLLAVTVSYASQKALNTFPDVASKIVWCLGIQAVFDPLFCLFIDCTIQVSSTLCITDSFTMLSILQ